MKVADYRNLIAHANRVAGLDYHSCVTGHERRVWLGIAIRVRNELAAAHCPRANINDRVNVEAASHRLSTLITAAEYECKTADANLQRMAFGAEYR